MEEKITIVVCSRENDEQKKDFIEHLKKTCEYDSHIMFLINSDGVSLTTIYDDVMNKIESNIVIFIHDDIEFLKNGWGREVVRLFNDNKEYGIIGIAGSAEFDENSTHKIIGNDPELYKNVKLINNMRLGDFECKIFDGTLASKLYNSNTVLERHKTNIEFNNSFKNDFENVGVVFSAINPQANLVELIELKDKNFFVACNFLPEYQSRPLNAHPLFEGFIAAALKR